MNKKSLFLLTLALLLILTPSAFAKQPDFTIAITEPTSPLTLTSSPLSVNVSGTFSIATVQNFKLEVQKGDAAYTVLVGPLAAVTGKTWGPYTWSITETGTYTLKVSARHGNRDYLQTKTIIVNSSPPPVTPPSSEDNPAAPAVASRLLKAAGIKFRHSGGNYVAQIARQMGPGTDFNGVAKSNVAAYETAVRLYLKNTLGAPLP